MAGPYSLIKHAHEGAGDAVLADDETVDGAWLFSNAEGIKLDGTGYGFTIDPESTWINFSGYGGTPATAIKFNLPVTYNAGSTTTYRSTGAAQMSVQALTDRTEFIQTGGRINFTVPNSSYMYFQGTHLHWIRDGSTFRISDSGDTDYVEMYHNGSDFVSDFTNTVDWNITGIDSMDISASIWIIGGNDFAIFDSAGSSYMVMDHPGSVLRAQFVSTSNFDFEGLTGNVRIRDGAGIQLFDASDSDTALFKHNGTDFLTTLANTAEWKITGATDYTLDGNSIANSDGTTAGSGSAGAGNQYVELKIGATTYKVLHDGTV